MAATPAQQWILRAVRTNAIDGNRLQGSQRAYRLLVSLVLEPKLFQLVGDFGAAQLERFDDLTSVPGLVFGDERVSPALGKIFAALLDQLSGKRLPQVITRRCDFSVCDGGSAGFGKRFYRVAFFVAISVIAT